MARTIARVDARPYRARAHVRVERPTSSRSTRYAALDGVRGIAILAVVGFHAGVPAFRGGSAGVLVFFALSGYLITTLLLQGPPITPRVLGVFYLRRFLRLFPAVAVLALVVSLWALFELNGGARHYAFAQSLYAIAYIQDFVLASHRTLPDWGYLGHTWSLAVEEQFYLVWPLALIVLARLRRSAAVAVVAVAFLGAAAWRMHLSYIGQHERVGVGLDGNAVALLAGCLLAYALIAAPDGAVRLGHRLHLAAVFACAVVLVEIASGTSFGLPYDAEGVLIALAAAVVIAELVGFPEGRLARLLSWWPLATIGVYSYSIYLWHPVVFAAFKHVFAIDTTRERVIWAVPMLLVVAALSFASYRWVETPFLRLKDRLRRPAPLPLGGDRQEQDEHVVPLSPSDPFSSLHSTLPTVVTTPNQR